MFFNLHRIKQIIAFLKSVLRVVQKMKISNILTNRVFHLGYIEVIMKDMSCGFHFLYIFFVLS